jgi:hypothetical protein
MYFWAQSDYSFTAQHFTVVNVIAQHHKKSRIKTKNSRNILTKRRKIDNATVIKVIQKL